MDGKGELRFIDVVEKTGEQEAKVRVFPQFRLGLNGIQSFLYNYLEVCTIPFFENLLRFSCQKGVLHQRSYSPKDKRNRIVHTLKLSFIGQ
jgi:hypothetical protein